MEFTEVVYKRRMVRNFTDEPVDTAVIERLLDLARRGPSAGFTQGQFFVVVTKPELRQKIGELCGEKGYVEAGFDPWISKAPVIVIPCTNETAYHQRYQEPDKLDEAGKELIWPIPFWYMDVGCAVMTLLLGVVDEGLAAGFAGTHHADKIQELLNIPKEVEPVGVIPIGHPAVDKRSGSLKRGRRPLTDVVHFEQWS